MCRWTMFWGEDMLSGANINSAASNQTNQTTAENVVISIQMCCYVLLIGTFDRPWVMLPRTMTD